MGQLMGQWVRWVLGLGYDGSDGSWVTNGDPWSTLYYSIVPSSEMSGSVGMFVCMFVCLYVYALLARPFKIKI